MERDLYAALCELNSAIGQLADGKANTEAAIRCINRAMFTIKHVYRNVIDESDDIIRALA